MFAPGNLKYEEMRAQEIVNTLTDRKKAAILFASARSQNKHVHAQADVNERPVNNGGAISRLFKALKPNRAAVANDTAQNPC